MAADKDGMPRATPDRRIASFALILVVATACAGIVACTLGAFKWGLLGLSIGLAGTWALFLLGLFGLYHREHNRHADDAYSLAEVEEAPRSVQTSDF